MSGMKFTKDHEWILIDDEGIALVGITDYAQNQLGELVYVELPEIGAEITRGAETVVIESVKATSDVKAPATGTVVAVNEALADEPDKVNDDPTGDGWLVKIKLSNPGELDELIDESAYNEYTDSL